MTDNATNANGMPKWFDRDESLRHLEDMILSLDGMELTSNDYADTIKELNEAVKKSDLPSEARKDFAHVCAVAGDMMVLVHNATNVASRATERVADTLGKMPMPAKESHPKDDAGDDDRALLDAAAWLEKDMRDLVSVRYDEADHALDNLEFVMCALASMESVYSDEVTCGCMNVIDDAITTLRKYTDDVRAALTSAMDGTDQR